MLMRTLWWAVALLVLGFTVPTLAADKAVPPANVDHWYDKLNPFAGKKQDAVPTIPPTVPLPADLGTASGSTAYLFATN